jgi:hypothetical protein
MGGKSIRLFVVVALCAAALAVPAYASLGSIIDSSLVADDWRSFAYGVARDDTYLYYLGTEMHPAYDLHYTNFAGGSGIAYIGGWPAAHRDADASALGPGYFADVYRLGSSGPFVITDFDINTGSAVASWAPLDLIVAYAYNPACGIRYVSDGIGRIHRYNTAGSLLSSFITVGITGIAATNEFAGNQGEYIIATWGDYWYVYDASGVEIERVRFPWEHASMKYSACGPGHPSEYGTTLWCIVSVYGEGSYLCQISLHNATVVEPASVGRIKALYR